MARLTFVVLWFSCTHVTSYIVIILNLAFENSKMTVELDGREAEYYRTTMTPANWYQWFDGSQPEDGPWIEV